MIEPITPGLAGSDFLRVDANGVPRIKLPDGRWAALEAAEVDGVIHFAASATDIVHEAPPHPGTVALDYVNARAAEMKQRDQPESEAETSELRDDLELTVWRAGRDPHMERLGLDGLWRSVWVRWRQKHAPKIAVRNAIDVLVSNGGVAAADRAESILGLTADMERHWPVVLAKLGPLDGDPAELDRRAKDALLALGGGVNPSLDKQGAKAAKALRPIDWPDLVPLGRVVATALWAAETGPRLEKARTHGPGIPPFAALALAAIGARATQVAFTLGEKEEKTESVQDWSGRVVGEVKYSAEIDPEILKMIDRRWLQHIDAHRFWRWLVNETWWQKYQLDLARPNEIVLEGGYGALAERLGIAGGKQKSDLRKIVETLRYTSVRYRGIHVSSLLNIEYFEARRGRASKLKLIAMGPFGPGFFDEWGDRLTRDDRQILPLPVPSMMPAFVGRENEWAPQAMMHTLTFGEIRARGPEYVALGGALSINDQTWKDLANKAEVPRTLLPEVLEAWHRGDDQSPPFLVREGGIYRLGPAYWREHRTIWEGAQRMVHGKKGGELGKARRRRKLGL